jgi:hypothetical protein
VGKFLGRYFKRKVRQYLICIMILPSFFIFKKNDNIIINIININNIGMYKLNQYSMLNKIDGIDKQLVEPTVHHRVVPCNINSQFLIPKLRRQHASSSNSYANVYDLNCRSNADFKFIIDSTINNTLIKNKTPSSIIRGSAYKAGYYGTPDISYINWREEIINSNKNNSYNCRLCTYLNISNKLHKLHKLHKFK